MAGREKAPLESQVRILYAHSGGVCAYPQCGRVLVMLPLDAEDLPKNTAKVAHIAAASPGGPRYDPSMTESQRRGCGNLILLCGDHHDAIDGQSQFHTHEWLVQVKRDHESRMTRARAFAIGEVGFHELELVCSALGGSSASAAPDALDELEPAMSIDAKLDLNDLTDDTRSRVRAGLAQQLEVMKFVDAMNNMQPGFGSRLTARFKAAYFDGLGHGLAGDDLFDSVLGFALSQCGPRLTPRVEGAALAVVAHLFSICEIFEHEPSAA